MRAGFSVYLLSLPVIFSLEGKGAVMGTKLNFKFTRMLEHFFFLLLRMVFCTLKSNHLSVRTCKVCERINTDIRPQDQTKF